MSELDRLRVTLGALDHGVRAAHAMLPAEVAARWRDFFERGDRLLAVLEHVREPALQRAQAASLVEQQLADWAGALARYGVRLSSRTSVGLDGFISPSRARARMDGVDAEVTNLDRVIRANKERLGRSFVAGWERWRDAWRQFYARYPRDWDWWYLGNASAWNETLVFQQRLAQYAEAVQRTGVHSALPLPQPPPERVAEGSWLGDLRGIAIASALSAAVLGAVYVVHKVS